MVEAKLGASAVEATTPVARISVVSPTEGHDRAVVRMQVRRHVAQPEVAVRRPVDAARREDAFGVGVDQQRQQQPWVILRLAAGGRAHGEGAERHPINRGNDETRHVVRGQPVLRVRRQQEGLVTAKRNELRHAEQIRRSQAHRESDRLLETP
jgi:hypothetical protein